MNKPAQYIIRIMGEQFKKINLVDFRPNRYVTKISGANGAGKTSVLDLIFFGFAPRKTLSPSFLKQGQKKGYMEFETTTHIIRRKLDDKGGGLQIEDKATGNLVKDPVEWLERAVGDLGFDPLDFMRRKPEEQFEVLKGLLELDADIDDLTQRNIDDDETITRRKAEAKRLEAARDLIQVNKELPTEPVNVEKLLKESREAADFNEGIEREKRQRAGTTQEGQNLLSDIDATKRRILDLTAEINRLDAELAPKVDRVEAIDAEMKAWKPLPAPRDRIAIDERISASTARNQLISSNNANKTQRENLNTQAEGIRAELETLAANIRERKLTIARTLEKAKFPIPGLSFETIEEQSSGKERKHPKKIVTYNGIPLSEASSAEQIRVSASIGMASKSDLRFLIIREGSLLDENGWEILERMAYENDYQILCEVVDTSGKVGIYMEDGEIKTVNAAPEPGTPAPAKTRKSKKKVEAQ